MFKTLSLLVFIVTANVLHSEMPEPYKSINDLPFDEHGWFFNASQLEDIIQAKQPKVVIEIGSWLGCSTRFIASKIQTDGKLYAVDTWKGSIEHQNDLGCKRRLPNLYQLFLSNIKHADLTEKIISIRMESNEAAVALNVMADLIYIDAAHDKSSVIADIMNWYPHLKEKGVMCGDDWDLSEEVREAVTHCASVFGKQVKAINNFWYYE